MDPARLVEGYQSIMKTIYSSREYYERALECLRRVTYGPSPRYSSVLHDFVSLARITLKLGILDRERWEFWRFVREATAKHRDKLADSLRLAAMGYHFRKLTEAEGR
jgi:hypothetical protein